MNPQQNHHQNRTNGKWLALTLTGALLGGTSSASAETTKVEIPIPKGVLITAFNAGLDGMEVVVDNYGSKHGTSWFKSGSYVRLPDGTKRTFQEEIPERTTDIKLGKTTIRRFRHYIDQFTSYNLTAKADGDRINLVVEFESQGEEIKGKCLVPKLGGGWRGCANKFERDVHLNNAILIASVKPTAHNGSISYKQPDVNFDLDVQIPNALCQLASPVCSAIEGELRSAIRKAVRNAVKTSLNDSKLKDSVASALRNGLAPYVDPAWKVTKVASQGSKFVVTVEKPVVIDGSTVSVKTFKVTKSHATTSCPTEVAFKATINTKSKVKGTLYLEHENGTKSGQGPWNMPKAGSATETLERTFKAKAGKKANGWTRMVLRYKGTDDKTHVVKSGKANFSRSCTHGNAGGLKQKDPQAKPGYKLGDARPEADRGRATDRPSRGPVRARERRR